MAHRSILCAVATAALLVPTSPAVAAPVESGHIDDVFVEQIPDLCGVPAILDHDVHINYTFNPRTGLYRESARGTVIWTNLETGKTFTEIFSSSSRDHEVVDNGDGTLTILVYAAGGYRSLDSDGRIFLRDPGTTRFHILIDAETGEFIEFVDVVKESTGLNELEGREFCEDFHMVTD